MTDPDDTARLQILERFQAWDGRRVPVRKYALLVAGYYRTCFPPARFGADGGAAFGRRVVGLLRWVEEAADRPLCAEEQASAARCAEESIGIVGQWDLNNSPLPRYDLWEPIRDLQLALADPRRAAATLVGMPDAPADNYMGWHPVPSYHGLWAVMECLQPATWDAPAPDWTPPPEAVGWARRIYHTKAFGDLPVLADLLEDAECPDQPLLEHCRNHACHYRGCAALDRILGGQLAEPDQHIRLVGLTPKFEGKVWSFSDPFEVGRTPPGLVLDDPPGHTVSRRHAVVYPHGGWWWVADRGSANGTHLNGTRLGTEAAGPLRVGDILQFSAVALQVVSAVPGGHDAPAQGGPVVSPGGTGTLSAEKS